MTNENGNTKESANADRKDSASDSQRNRQNTQSNSDESLNSSKNEVKFRDNLYRMIISQLFYDGYQHIAVGLSEIIQVVITQTFVFFFLFVEFSDFNLVKGDSTLSSLQSFVQFSQKFITEQR